MRDDTVGDSISVGAVLADKDTRQTRGQEPGSLLADYSNETENRRENESLRLRKRQNIWT